MHNPQSEESPALYPMRLVTRLTGLSADTIRAWERRHNAVTPSRSSGNTRRFTAEEVRRLVLLREATEGGHSIRTIAPLELGELERLVSRRELPLDVVPANRAPASRASFRELRQALLGAFARFDARRAFDLLMRGATFLDRQTFVFEVVLPVAREVKNRWSQQTVGSAQQQMLFGHLRAVLMALLRLNPPPLGAPRMLLATIEGDHEEGRLLVSALLATAMAKDPIYVGPGLSAAEIEWAVRMSRADVWVLTAGPALTSDQLHHLSALAERLRPGVQVWGGVKVGHPLVSLMPLDAHFTDFEGYLEFLKGLTAVAD